MGKITKSLIVGAALGAITALLLAPRTGKQTRKLVHEKYEKIRRQLAQDIAKAKKLSQKQYAALVDKAMKLAKKGETTKDELMELRDDLLARWDRVQKHFKTK